MKTKVSPTVIGLFVLGAFVLLLVALLSFGGVSFFSRPQRFAVYFNETIHGLDLGSPVKLRGVRVGRVVDLAVRYDVAGHKSDVMVVCEFNRNVVTTPAGVMVDVSSRAVLQDLIDRGLRAQLGVLGLATGMLYVELNFLDPKEYPANEKTTDLRFATIPALPSAISEYQASLSQILSDLRKVDFAALSKEARGLLVDARRQINKLEVKDLIAEWTQAAQAVRGLANAPEVRQAITHTDEAAQELKRVLVKLEGQVEPTGARLAEVLTETKQAVESFNAAATTLRKFINAQQSLGTEAGQAMLKLGEAADSVQRLADFLERNPGALLTGRKKPE